ncbi:MAG: TonB-dependent receptor [Paludibacteraceae bacterium]|nr:TonB-dependent receptor [Paludibacteraceae bacterium]
MLLSDILLAALLSAEPFIGADTSVLHIDEVTVTASRQRQLPSPLSSVQLTGETLRQQVRPSLAMSLNRIAGVQASAVGSAQSRPAIRGLGFNRLSVIRDGIRHEGQQWGEDHGLEIDQFSIDRIEVIKGPAALLYGSDAVGGALVVSSAKRPTLPIEGQVHLFTRTNNLLFGGSARIEGIRKGFFWRVQGTWQDYADYRVPTDSIEYHSYRIPLHKQTLRNTAGREADGSLTLGYAAYRWHTCLKVYETYAASGFFANAHGLEVRLSDIDYDRSRRDIDLPRQQVNHLQVLSHTVYTGGEWALEADLAWQHNLRSEFSEPVSHGYMPTPDSELERQFSKHTATANFTSRWQVHKHHTLRFGLNTEMQHNRRSGWGFILPDFETYSAGIYASERWEATPFLTMDAGLRYDYTYINIHAYSDWYTTPNLSSEEGGYLFRQRSQELQRNFHSFTWSAGISYHKKGWLLKVHAGKAFRVPTAKELGTNGVNYHIFRYEEGNAGLHAEESYQADLSAAWENKFLHIQAEPFFGWFPNYIYLCPTSGYSEGLQVYHYTQAQVVRTGFEAELTARPWEHLELRVQGEWLFARQLSGDKRGYGLPFSPPWRLMPEVKFVWGKEPDSSNPMQESVLHKVLSKGYFAVDVRLAGAQHDIVPPEKPTDGWWTLNLQAGQCFRLTGCTLSLSLTAENLLDTKYYDHTSYYRLIDIPEPGWNIGVMAGVIF